MAGTGAWVIGAGVGLALHFAGSTLGSWSATATFVVAALAYALMARQSAPAALSRG